MNKPPYTFEVNADHLVEQLDATLHRYCLSLTQSVWDSDDLAQDTWLKIIEKMQAEQHHNPEALLLRTAKNAWIDQVRRRKVYERIMDKEREQVKGTPEPTRADNSLDVELAFHYLIQHLSPLQRSVLLLRSIFGFSVTETAAKLHTTEGAVKAAYHRARNKLEVSPQELEELNISPHNEDLKIRLQVLAASYMEGEVDEVLRLIQDEQDQSENVIAMGTFLAQPKQSSGVFGYSSNPMGIRMAV